MEKTFAEALSWHELKEYVPQEPDLIRGATNSYSLLRLFDQEESSVRVILYRDHHAWCPYCQKVWLWLELKQVPYRIKKITMRCYGDKERFYLKKVPSGLLPAIEINNILITESDQILLALENSFGPLGKRLEDKSIIYLRNLERRIFRSWCLWLCRPGLNYKQEQQCKNQFQLVAKEIEEQISSEDGPWLDSTLNKKNELIPGTIDIIFLPYLERMNASLAYYKGYNVRKEFPIIDNWFKALEQLSEYRGTQGDFHTHSHDLPPQMGGCWIDKNPNQIKLSGLIDSGEGLGEMETTYSIDNYLKDIKPERIALSRVVKHRLQLLEVNPLGSSQFDQPLRAALSKMISGNNYKPNEGSAIGLRYLRDRISVPRDMPLLAARKLRSALEKTAEMDGKAQAITIPTTHRFDQNPAPFLKAKKEI